MVSNFRPVTASALYKLFCDKNDTVWDMSCGWGGRLLASIKAEINYIGTDPNTQTQKGLKEMVTTFGNGACGYELLTMGSEEYRPDKNSLDFAFTSPPYFDTEKYSETETTQSYLKYSNINAWKEDFLRKTLENVHYGLKPNKFCAFNVADVKSYETFEKDTKQIASEVGFKLVDTFDLRLSSQANDYKAEPIFIFKKEQ
jgi:tRNA G10  N-methylase Trm11